MKTRSTLQGVVWLVAVAYLPLALLAQTTTHYWMNYPKDLRGWLLILPAPVEKPAFRNAMTAIDLKSVVCDGVSLAAETLLIAGRPDKTTVSLGAGTVMYQFSQGFFECWIDLQSMDQSNEIRRFTLPRSSNVIEVQYRVRTPDGRTSAVMTVTFYSSDEKTHIFVVP